MLTYRGGWWTLCVLTVASCAWAQPAPVGPRESLPVARPGEAGMGRSIRGFRSAAPVGYQARYVRLVVVTNREELKVTDAQIKTIDANVTAMDVAAKERASQRTRLTDELNKLGEAYPPDLAKIQAKIGEIKKLEADDMMADVKLTASIKDALTPEQRDKLKTISPRFEGLTPPPAPLPRPDVMIPKP